MTFGGVAGFGGFGLRGGMAKKPNLDEATVEIARRMLSTPPRPHEEMKIGKPRKKAKAKVAPRRVVKGGR